MKLSATEALLRYTSGKEIKCSSGMVHYIKNGRSYCYTLGGDEHTCPELTATDIVQYDWFEWDDKSYE